MRKIVVSIGIACVVLLASCNKDEIRPYNDPGPSPSTQQHLRSNTNGSAGIELVYYDSMLVKMNLKEMSSQSATSLIAHNGAINVLYEADGFNTVTDAIQGDGYNPIWRVTDIIWNPGFTPHQFYRDDAVIAAASGPNPEITLVVTNEVYRCDIIQHTKLQ
jgi:hypothetical protein